MCYICTFILEIQLAMIPRSLSNCFASRSIHLTRILKKIIHPLLSIRQEDGNRDKLKHSSTRQPCFAEIVELATVLVKSLLPVYSYIDHFAVGVIYLRFPIQVSFSSTVFHIHCLTFSRKIRNTVNPRIEAGPRIDAGSRLQVGVGYR